jgi:hypothetical protein
MLAFWFKNEEKCKMKMKKTSPTPKSITHKNPIKMSPSSKSRNRPNNIKYKPPRYHSVMTLYVLTKKIKVMIIKLWSKNTSLSIYSLLTTSLYFS